MDLLDQPLASAEFLAVDVETNGCAGEDCELTEVGAVLVGGGELHERFESLVAARAPLSRAVQRLTGISQAMLDAAPEPDGVLAELARRLEGRVMVAHNAAFDRRALAGGFARAGLEWPDPPALCTVALARRFAPLARRRALGPLAESLGIDVAGAHRALVDAESCARVFCALFPRLCAHAATVGEALALVSPRRRRRARAAGRLPKTGAPAPAAPLDFSACRTAPACTCSATPPAAPCTWASRSRCGRGPGRTSRRAPRPLPGRRTPRWSTIAPPRRSWGRWCWRAG